MSNTGETDRRSVQLASNISSPLLPTTIFIHGLDSSKETWAGTLSQLSKIGYPAMAIDLRGHGESPLGKIIDFTPENLAHDIFSAVKQHGICSPYVLVGHSMGGRIAMRLAAIEVEEYARGRRVPRLAACVIEDMDTRIRTGTTPTDESLDQDQLNPFERAFESWNLCRDALLPCKSIFAQPLPFLKKLSQGTTTTPTEWTGCVANAYGSCPTARGGRTSIRPPTASHSSESSPPPTPPLLGTALARPVAPTAAFRSRCTCGWQAGWAPPAGGTGRAASPT